MRYIADDHLPEADPQPRWSSAGGDDTAPQRPARETPPNFDKPGGAANESPLAPPPYAPEPRPEPILDRQPPRAPASPPPASGGSDK